MLRCEGHVSVQQSSAQDIWIRKYQELWEKLEETTKSSFCTALWKWLVLKTKNFIQTVTHSYRQLNTYMWSRSFFTYMFQAWCDKRGFDTAIHPISKCVIFLEDLLQEMVDKKSKDPFGTSRVARKALSKIRYFTHVIDIIS